MSKDYEGMSEAEAMSELARLLWERYMKPRATKELLNHSLDGYKAQVYSNNEDGTLTVIRPFDNTSMTLKCPPALAESAEAGDQVLVIQLGDASNSFILCGTDMSGFGEGGSGQFRPVSFDFSDIGDGYFTEVVEDKDGNQVTTIYDVTFDINGRIDSVTSRADNWETEVEWGTYERLPAADVGFDPTGTSLQSNTVQGAIVEVANGGGGGGGSGASETIIATVEASTTASKNYAVKDYLIMSGVLYRVTSPISSGATITIGTNVTPAVLGNDVAAHIQNTSNPHQVTAAQAGAMPSTATLDDIPNGTTYAKPTAAQVAQIGTNQTAISAIEGKIPSAASPLNQLADKDFVTDSITQGTAIFRGSFASKAALLAVQWQTTNPSGANYVSNNDYAVVLDDESQNDECWRYIYVTGTGWSAQYRINESPMTQAQLDALNSGATAAIISSVGDKLDKTGDGKDVTATFTAASTRTNISTGEKLSVIFGKIAKWFADLGTAAFAAISTSTPQMDGTGAAGNTGQVSDAGHTHPTDTSRAPAGFGLGVYLNTLTVLSNADNVTATGWYVTDTNTTNLPPGRNTSYTGSIYAVCRGSLFTTETYYDFAGGKTFIRTKDQNGWKPWTVESSTTDNAIASQVAYAEATTIASRNYSVGDYLCWNGNLYKVTAEISSGDTLYSGSGGNIVMLNNGVANAVSTNLQNQLATVETGPNSSKAYAVGEYFCWGGTLYRAKTAIASGASFTVGTNCEAVTVGEELNNKAPAGYGLGVLLNTLSNVTNANNAAVTGWYPTLGGITTNLPSGADGTGVLMVVARGDAYKYQLYFDFTGKKLYHRISSVSGVWSIWSTFASL